MDTEVQSHRSNGPSCFVAVEPAVGPSADVAVIIVNYNTAHLLERCISALRQASEGLRVQVIVVDNASRDGSVAFIRSRFTDCTLIANADNVGFARANNQALAACHARHLLLLNADAFVRPDALHKSVAYMDAHPECGVLGAQLVDEHGNGVFSGRVFPSPLHGFLQRTGLSKWLTLRAEHQTAEAGLSVDGARNCDWVVGCYYFVRQEVIRRIGLFDPRYFLYFEEVDHCRAVHAAGWGVRCLTEVHVVHEGGGSAESEGELSVGRQISALQTESSLLYFRKHGGLPGVWWAASLALLTEGVLGMKWLLKLRPLGGLAAFGGHARTVCRLMVQTRGGLRPTR